jgi:cephalosporin hydroxylase
VPEDQPSAADVLDLTVREWAERHQRELMEVNSWMGLPMRKTPLDAWIYQELIHRVAPERIVEIGSFAGGSTLYFAHLLDLLGSGRVVSVDVSRERYVAEHPRIDEVTGDSHDPEVVERVSALCAGRRTFVVHDGDHNRAAVLADLRAYADLVSIDSYFVVEDGILDLFPVGSGLHPPKFPEGPLPAIRQFVDEDDRFAIDGRCERFGVTWNPMGFLRRVR